MRTCQCVLAAFVGITALSLFAVQSGRTASGIGVSAITLGVDATPSKMRFARPLCGFDAVSNGVANVVSAGLIYNLVCDDSMLNGVAVAGLLGVNSPHSEANGIQIAGFANMMRDESRLNGLQVGLFNIMGPRSEVRGLQVGLDQMGPQWYSYGVNIGWETIGCSGAGVLISAAGNIDGAFLDYSLRLFGGNTLGKKISLSDEYCGLEIGFVNAIHELAGAQVGVINYADSLAGVQIGLLNVAGNASVKVLPVVNWAF